MIQYDETKFTSFGLLGPQINYLIDKYGITGGDYCNGVWIIPIAHHDTIYAEVTPYSTFRQRVVDYYDGQTHQKVNAEAMFPAFGASGTLDSGQ